VPYFNSKAITCAEYDAASRVLKLWFVGSGGPYDYFGVPQNIYDGLLKASSKGRYYNQYIRDQYGR